MTTNAQNTATFKAPVCCGAQLKVEKKGDTFQFRCPKCGKTSTGKTPIEAGAPWSGTKQAAAPQPPASPEAILTAIPECPGQLQTWASYHMSALMKASAAFIDKPQTTRMIEKNLKYIVRHPGLDKVWASEEGRESIIEALEEALYIGATLPEMGSIVPYGSIAEFIPSVEAFEFALTTGKNAPFEWISIECIHEHDVCKRARVNGNFQIEFEHIPNVRGEVVAIAVYGLEKKRGIVVGDIYEKARLMEKAAVHSQSYKYYLQDIAGVQAARSEGKVKIEAGREYIEKTMPVKGGQGTWTKKIFLDELHNPYEGGDQPEMLKKAAGKSFFRPWMKVRNSIEAAGEWDRDELEGEAAVGSAIDSALSRAKESVKPSNGGLPPEGEIIDGEVIEPEPEPAKEREPVRI